MRLLFYPTLYKGVTIPKKTEGGGKCNCLTAYYSHGPGGFDLRPFVLEMKDKSNNEDL